MLSSSPTHQRIQSLDSTGSSTAATTPATPTAGGFGITSPNGPGAGSQGQQAQLQQQPSSLLSGKSGLASPDTTAATSPRPSAATTPVTMFGDTLLHHRATKQVGSSLYSSAHLPGYQVISTFAWFVNQIIFFSICCHMTGVKNVSFISTDVFHINGMLLHCIDSDFNILRIGKHMHGTNI